MNLFLIFYALSQLLFNRNDKYMFRLPKKASLAKLGSRHPLPNPYYIDYVNLLLSVIMRKRNLPAGRS